MKITEEEKERLFRLYRFKKEIEPIEKVANLKVYDISYSYDFNCFRFVLIKNNVKCNFQYGLDFINYLSTYIYCCEKENADFRKKNKLINYQIKPFIQRLNKFKNGKVRDSDK